VSFADWNRGGNFDIGGQGVLAVPEPGGLALAGLALLALGLSRQRRA
jgi:hypothetical protein